MCSRRTPPLSGISPRTPVSPARSALRSNRSAGLRKSSPGRVPASGLGCAGSRPKLFLIGRGPDGRLSAFERTFDRCMGLFAAGPTLWLSTRFQLWRLENALHPGKLYQGYDRLYVPRVGYTTGDLDGHDVAVEASG